MATRLWFSASGHGFKAEEGSQEEARLHQAGYNSLVDPVQAEADRIAVDQAEADRLAVEKAEADRLEAEAKAKAEADKLAAEKAAADAKADAAEKAEAVKGAKEGK